MNFEQVFLGVPRTHFAWRKRRLGREEQVLGEFGLGSSRRFGGPVLDFFFFPFEDGGPT
jgi:hypothetical protein